MRDRATIGFTLSSLGDPPAIEGRGVGVAGRGIAIEAREEAVFKAGEEATARFAIAFTFITTTAPPASEDGDAGGAEAPARVRLRKQVDGIAAPTMRRTKVSSTLKTTTGVMKG